MSDKLQSAIARVRQFVCGNSDAVKELGPLLRDDLHKLLAAAERVPELCEALNELLDWALENTNLQPGSTLHDMARAALAKVDSHA